MDTHPHAGEPTTAPATVCINADGSQGQDTYALMESYLGPNWFEHPDHDHSPPVRHLRQDTDDEVGPHFVIVAHKNDSDRGAESSKTRIEFKVHTGAAEALKGTPGKVLTYTWRFKMDPEMVFSPRYNVMFQLKSVGGHDGPPLIALKVVPSGGQDSLVVQYMTETAERRTLAAAPAADLRGLWLQVYVRTEIGDDAAFFMTVRKPDDTFVIAVDTRGLAMWRGGRFIRPKWGLYRGRADNLREEEIVRFANIGITPGSRPTSDCRLFPPESRGRW